MDRNCNFGVQRQWEARVAGRCHIDSYICFYNLFFFGATNRPAPHFCAFLPKCTLFPACWFMSLPPMNPACCVSPLLFCLILLCSPLPAPVYIHSSLMAPSEPCCAGQNRNNSGAPSWGLSHVPRWIKHCRHAGWNTPDDNVIFVTHACIHIDLSLHAGSRTHADAQTLNPQKLLAPLMGDSELLAAVIKHFQAALPSPNLLPVSLSAPQTLGPAS